MCTGAVYSVLILSIGHTTLCTHFQCFVDVVELDEEMLAVAEKWFDFHRGERLNVYIADGVRFVSECIFTKKHGESLNIRSYRTHVSEWLYFPS